MLYGGEKHVVSSDYLFEERESVLRIAKRITQGETHLAPVKVTIPEGFTVADIGGAFSIKLLSFDKANFLVLATNKEGYLFPDTYFFLTTADEEDALKSLSDNFNKKIAPLMPEITASGKTENEIITMASIIEREAEGDVDRAMISGILWKRLRAGIALQVDAAPVTYKERGLPDKPISNPGLEAIKAAIHPESSPYLYYLHSKDGLVHYAKTFAEHRMNVKLYLK